jgi:hypothetical protein
MSRTCSTEGKRNAKRKFGRETSWMADNGKIKEEIKD